MSRTQMAALRLVALNGMFGVGLFLPMLAFLEAKGAPGMALQGLLAAAFPLVEGVAGLIYPRLLRIASPKLLMTASQLLCAAGCLVLVVADSFWALLLARSLGGIGGAGIVVTHYIIGSATDGSERVRRLGQIGAAAALGFILGLVTTAATGALLPPDKVIGAAGAIAACVGLAGAALVALTSWDMDVRPVAASPGALPKADLILYGLNTTVYIGLAVAMSIWAGSRPELGLVGTGLLFIVLAIVSMVFQSRIASHAVERMGHRAAIASGFACIALGSLAFSLQIGLATPIFGLVIARLGYSVIVPALLARILGSGPPAATQTRAGLSIFAASIGSWTGPVIVGVLGEASTIGWAVICLASIASAATLAALLADQAPADRAGRRGRSPVRKA